MSNYKPKKKATKKHPRKKTRTFNIRGFPTVPTARGSNPLLTGSRAGTGYTAAFSYGLTAMVAMVAMVVMALFFNSSVVMIEQSLRKRYDGPGEAVTAVFEMFVEHGTMMMTPEIIGTLLIGGIGAGLVTEFFGSRYS